MLSSWVRSSAAKIAPAAIERAGNLLVLPPDEAIAPFDHPIDLEGRSVMLQRRSATTYATRTTALQYDTQSGAVLKTFEDSDDQNEHARYTLQRFTVPFGSQQVRDLHISERIGIFTVAPPPTATEWRLSQESMAIFMADGMS